VVDLISIALDRIDAAILQLIQRNNRLTSGKLGSYVNLSPSACQRRLKRLRAEGIVESEIAIVSPKALGRAVTMVVLTTVHRKRHSSAGSQFAHMWSMM
jgi:Lrp/AsnC family transcriptional regulator, leucine-responsive regulatory protein